MVNKGSSTPDRILDAAEILFAGEGIDATTLTAITSAAGARNKSAIAYHFGSKMDVLEAVLARHQRSIDEHRDRILDAAELDGRPTLADLVHAMVEPVLVQLGDPAGERYLQIQAALLSYPRREALPESLRDPTRRLRRLQSIMRQITTADPSPETTRALIVSIVFHGLADFARTNPTKRQRAEFGVAITKAITAILQDREKPRPAAPRSRAGASAKNLLPT